jgi:hypothetical protein
LAVSPLGKRLGTHCTGGSMGLRVGLEGIKILPPQGFNPCSIETMVSRYTDYAIMTAKIFRNYYNKMTVF